MKALIALALSAGTLVAIAPADARQGCGPGFHRAPDGRCFPNRGPGAYGPGYGPGPGFVVGNFYRDRGGYWDGRRFWHNRRAYHGGWRYY